MEYLIDEEFHTLWMEDYMRHLAPRTKTLKLKGQPILTSAVSHYCNSQNLRQPANTHESCRQMGRYLPVVFGYKVARSRFCFMDLILVMTFISFAAIQAGTGMVDTSSNTRLRLREVPAAMLPASLSITDRFSFKGARCFKRLSVNGKCLETQPPHH